MLFEEFPEEQEDFKKHIEDQGKIQEVAEGKRQNRTQKALYNRSDPVESIGINGFYHMGKEAQQQQQGCQYCRKDEVSNDRTIAPPGSSAYRH